MGHSSKKKKRGGGSGGGRRSKGRTPSKDHNSQGGDGYDVIADEITALCAIFQEDCKVVSDSPPQINIKLRPYSKDTGYEDLDISAFLSVRCLPGYPHKCPKLQINPEKGLSKADADNLLALLHEQANSNAREGRVMIYNLVEAAQEFLSEIVPFEGQSHDSVPCRETDGTCQSSQNDAVVSYSNSWSAGPFVYGFLDLFSGSGESWNWGLEVGDNGGIKTSVHSPIVAGPKDGYATQKKEDPKQKPAALIQDTMKVSLVSPEKLDIVDEVCEDEMKTISATDSDGFLSEEPDGSDTMEESKDVFIKELTEKADDDSDCESSEFAFPASLASTYSPQTMEKDMILAHLLRLACAPKGQLAGALPNITTELFNLGVISEWVRDLATKPSSFFEKTFQRVFERQLASSRITHFWKAASDFEVQNTVSVLSSRYLNDFDELHPLGQGGFGHVVLCKNKLDGRQYAMKKIRLKDKSLPVNDRILREVATLSRLQHQHVVRYYQAWFETGLPGGDVDAIDGSMTAASSSFSYMGASYIDQDSKSESTYLYIQMEYCPRTLRQMFESYSHFDKELAWHLFRQIVEGLAHIHGQGIIHRDLTPNNIFFDARNDIKIGDFGLAKFLKLGQLEQDPDPTEVAGVSIDGTGQVGTYFYTAPEIEQGWPKIDEKADMYSLGIVFFELWHPFGTAMERHIVLSDLKLKGEPPSAWATEYPDQASLLRRLMSPSPSDRPAATEVLQHALPPRMENELLDNLLRTMHTSEDSSVYDKVVNAIFDEDMSNTKDHGGGLDLAARNNDTSSSPIQLTDVDTEIRDQVVEVTVQVFRQRCAKRLEVVPLRLLGDCPQPPNVNAVKLLTRGGDKIELCHELRLPFVNWVIANQKLYLKRYEVSYVYRRSIGHSPPNRYLQGDFDIIGGTSGLTEAEIIKTAMDIIASFFNSECCDIHVNHGNLLDAIWSWVGIKAEHRKKVSELLSLMGSLRPHESPERKSKWGVIRRQLRQELSLTEAAVNRLQTVGSRFCGLADQALPRLRGALPAEKRSREALDQLSNLFSFLRHWRIEKRVFLDVLMPPTESYHRDMFFQIYLRKENNPVSHMEGTLLAVGGRYDYLVNQMWRSRYKSNPPGGVGVSIALETIIQNSSIDIKHVKHDTMSTSILVCSRGGGSLKERVELVAELWEENIKAEYVPLSDPSLTEQYEYANEHDIKCLVILNDTGVSSNSVKVRHLELKRSKEIERENLVKFLLEAVAVQFKNPSIWN